MLAVKLLVVVLCVAMYSAEDLYVGTTANNVMAFSETVKLSSIPLTTRTKNVFYNSNNATRIIKGIAAVDIDKSKARATITSGGVGSSYVNIKLKSNRGDGLNYLVQIFV
ncbi:uncharacterized protein LOC142973412 [Anticarsia gemmatalis]|uniref:uncharacterized protein LOC142973412 n=1 Tax=Anticarsia gemmatalis TaxID=129554 RepID=UPI003F76553A